MFGVKRVNEVHAPPMFNLKLQFLELDMPAFIYRNMLNKSCKLNPSSLGRMQTSKL
jgi:hypothetical protein